MDRQTKNYRQQDKKRQIERVKKNKLERKTDKSYRKTDRQTQKKDDRKTDELPSINRKKRYHKLQQFIFRFYKPC